MPDDTTAKPISGKISYHYQKSNYFRVIHADGAFGGLTASGNIHAAFWNERNPIPKITSREVKGGHVLGSEKVEDRLSGAVREVEVDVVMELATALAFHAWLEDKLVALRKQFGIPDKDWQQMWEETHGGNAKAP